MNFYWRKIYPAWIFCIPHEAWKTTVSQTQRSILLKLYRFATPRKSGHFRLQIKCWRKCKAQEVSFTFKTTEISNISTLFVDITATFTDITTSIADVTQKLTSAFADITTPLSHKPPQLSMRTWPHIQLADMSQQNSVISSHCDIRIPWHHHIVTSEFCDIITSDIRILWHYHIIVGKVYLFLRRRCWFSIKSYASTLSSSSSSLLKLHQQAQNVANIVIPWNKQYDVLLYND